MPRHDVFHFSCHGKTDSEEPLNSGLLVANDEFLTTRDFLSMDGMGARLAVLSACETGVPDFCVSAPGYYVKSGISASDIKK